MIKKIRFYAKLIKKYFFFNIYGSVKKSVSANREKRVSIKKICFNKKKIYNLYLIKNGRVFSNKVSDTAYFLDDNVIKEPSYQYRFNKKKQVVNGKINKNEVFNYGTPYFKKYINGTLISLLSGGAAKKNYWHWMYDTLPRLGLLEKANLNFVDHYFLLPSLGQKFQIETLSLLGIKQNKLIDCEKINHLEAKKIIATDHPVNFNNNPTKSILDIPDWIIKWLRKKYLTSIKNLDNFIGYEKIYIDRKTGINFDNRKIVNDEEVKSFLIKKGFKIISLENLNFKEQVFLFNSAKTIVGLHGAGLANVIFSKSRTKIIEIQSHSVGDMYKNLSLKCKLNYKRIIEKNINKKLKYQNFNINVNVSKLKKIIDEK